MKLAHRFVSSPGPFCSPASFSNISWDVSQCFHVTGAKLMCEFWSPSYAMFAKLLI